MAIEGENSLDWDEGMEGRGLVDQYGGIHTFDAEEYPFHADYEGVHGFQGTPRVYFYISPQGLVSMGPFLDIEGQLDKNADSIVDADPRLMIVAEGWNF